METPKTFKELFANTGIEPTTDESGNTHYNFEATIKGTNKIPNQTKKQIERQQKFEEAVRPLMKYLAENHHPHTSVYVTSRETALSEFQLCLSTDEYLVD